MRMLGSSVVYTQKSIGRCGRMELMFADLQWQWQ